MYRVLIPVDTNENRALAQVDYVTALPTAADAVEAYVLFVFTEESEAAVEDHDSASEIDAVRRAAETLEDAGIDVTIVEDSGDTEEDILEHAEAHDVDTIVLGGRKRSPVGKALFGSISQGVILNTDRPVVITGSKE
ncbi:universal stress protein [Natrinema limicola]|uniref:UspA domain-containing protein n=1 Tax=Natrinema limicola JCM 13563 TaxID=1230457 RepID=M0CIB9_9EURY|nr:universal stress protein [Natrinema limicola]ELZ22986.1 UspA domain-containing protein [Natrinema limicola JCM 13563]